MRNTTRSKDPHFIQGGFANLLVIIWAVGVPLLGCQSGSDSGASQSTSDASSSTGAAVENGVTQSANVSRSEQEELPGDADTLAAKERVFEFVPIGPAPFFRPTITNTQIVDFDDDGANDVIVCDAQTQAVYCYRRKPDGAWEEQLLGDQLIAPAHATVVDLDEDGDSDVVVSVMGNLYPDDGVIGSLVLLDNQDGTFVRKLLLDDVRRVVDAQPGDFDGDGDVDLAVAVFGYLRGQILWLENRGDGGFLDHELMSAPGTIHVPVDDYDGDGDVDIVAVVSQDEEEVWAFENVGGGDFKSRRLWTTVNYDIGAAGLVKHDLDGDGDADLLLPVGDNLEDSFSIPQPYHGCLWLENRGDWQFEAQRIATFPGAYAAAASDLDADGDQDVVLCSMVNHWDSPDAPSLVWLENDGRQNFEQHPIATQPIMLVTVDCGDLNGDERPDVVAGGLHLYPPFDRLGRVSSWLATDQRASAAPAPRNDEEGDDAIGAKDVPLPNLALVDQLTRDEFQRQQHRLANRVAEERDVMNDWLELGRAYYAFGFFPAAGECFRRAVDRDGQSLNANFLLGVSLQRMGELTPALAQFERTLEFAGGRQASDVWYEMGRCHLRLEDSEAAEHAFVRAGEHSRSLFQLAKLRLKLGRANDATAPLNQLAKLQPGTTELYLLSAQVTAALGDEKGAKVYRDRAEYNSRTMPPDVVTQMVTQYHKKYGVFRIGEQASQLIDEQDWDEAAPRLLEVTQHHWDKFAVVLLAGAELQRGRPNESIDLLTNLMRECGQFSMATQLLGDAYEKAGQTDDAVRLWQTTCRIQSSPEAHRRLADHFEKTGDPLAAQGERARMHQAMGIAKLRSANPSAALEDLKRAVELDAMLDRAWFYLGECRRFTGDNEGAGAAYRRARQLNPNHGRARSALNLFAK